MKPWQVSTASVAALVAFVASFALVALQPRAATPPAMTTAQARKIQDRHPSAYPDWLHRGTVALVELHYGGRTAQFEPDVQRQLDEMEERAAERARARAKPKPRRHVRHRPKPKAEPCILLGCLQKRR